MTKTSKQLREEIDNITAQIFEMVLKIKNGSDELPPSVFIPKVEKLINQALKQQREEILNSKEYKLQKKIEKIDKRMEQEEQEIVEVKSKGMLKP